MQIGPVRRIAIRILHRITGRPYADARKIWLYENGYSSEEEYRAAVTQKWIDNVARIDPEAWRNSK